MNWFESLIFGFFSGLSDVLPVSAQAHKTILLKLFGENSENPVLRLFIHIAVLAALYYCCSNQILRIARQIRLSKVPKKKRKRPLDVRTLMEFRLLKMILIPLALSLLLYNRTAPWGTKLNLTAIFLLLNGVVLYLPTLLPTGNKDARSMSRLEGLLMGLGGALSVIPGVSAVGGITSVASVCGAERSFALNLTYLANMALTVGLLAFDLAAVFAAELDGLSGGMLLTYLLAAAAAFGGTYLGIKIMRALAVNIGFSLFALYSFGAALISFVLYLMV